MSTAIQTIDELEELQYLYRLQRERIDRFAAAVDSRTLYRELETAAKLLAAITRVKEMRGIVGIPARAEEDLKLRFERFSESTVEALQNPESRRRVVSLLERLGRFGTRCALQRRPAILSPSSSLRARIASAIASPSDSASILKTMSPAYLPAE